MAVKWTEEQKKAITEKGNIIVSAAAGSGKTAVLTERVITALCNGQDSTTADRLLIVTFTNAAAAEMRSRIEKRLTEECSAHPDNVKLMIQKHLISSAKICTIDSFCIELIRENFEMANVSPTFKIVDEKELLPIYASAFDEILAENLQKGDKVFHDLADIMDCEYDFQNLKEAIVKLYRYSCQMPFPQSFLSKLIACYEKPFDINHPWYQNVLQITRQKLIDLQDMIVAALDLEQEIENGEKYDVLLRICAEKVAEIMHAVDHEDWDEIKESLSILPEIKLPRFTGSGEEKYNLFKSPRVELKEVCESLSEWFQLSRAKTEEQLRRLNAPMRFLIQLVNDFSERALSLQKEKDVYTFYNTEQMAFSMLCRETADGFEVTEYAKTFFDRYDEVLVDEYQDVNDLQDMLFRVLSDSEKHLFVVGDIKQSIYAFRGSNPRNFLERKNCAKAVSDAIGNEAKKIILSDNFRSRNGICEFVNFCFSQLMTEQTGKLVYGSDEELRAGAEFAENHAPTAELLILDKINYNNEESSKIKIEGKRIADYIHAVMQEEPFLQTENGLRRAEYSDFVILMRSPGSNGGFLAAELRRNGIPVTYSKETFLETTEIATFVSLLRVIDNPDNDIALMTVMLSPIFGFSVEEMAQYRINCRYGRVIATVTAAAQNGDAHACLFLEKLESFRRESVLLSLPKFLTRLLLVTDYSNIVSAMQDGKRRCANLQLLVHYAAEYHQNSIGGIGGFINYIDRLPDGTLASAKTGGGENVVRIMSMHASKGLQFPICILAHMNTDIHSNENNSNLSFDDNIGLGVSYYDEISASKIDTLPHKLLKEYKRREESEEELRILYVAMTRAQERMAIVMPFENLTTQVSSYACNLVLSGHSIGHYIFDDTSNMRGWILAAALHHPDCGVLRERSEFPTRIIPTESHITVSVCDASQMSFDVDEVESSCTAESDNDELLEKIKENLAYRYPFDKLRSVEAKSTVTILANHAERDRFEFTAKPAFMLENGVSAARRGTATHHVLQFIRFSEQPDVEAELSRLTEWAFITEGEAAAIDRRALREFFESPLYRRILSADEIHREMRFLTELPAGRVDADLPETLQNENIVVQGAIDLCIVENGIPTVIDFKTDRVTEPQELIDAYAEQLQIYSTACSKIFGRPVGEKIIYSFALGRSIIL